MKVSPFLKKRGYFLQNTRYFRQNNAEEGSDISSQKHLSGVRTLDLRPPDPPPPVRTMSEVLEVFFIDSFPKLEREEESHLLSGTCPVYADIHKEFTDFDSDDKLVSFFKMVLARRDEIDLMYVEYE